MTRSSCELPCEHCKVKRCNELGVFALEYIRAYLRGELVECSNFEDIRWWRREAA